MASSDGRSRIRFSRASLESLETEMLSAMTAYLRLFGEDPGSVEKNANDGFIAIYEAFVAIFLNKNDEFVTLD